MKEISKKAFLFFAFILALGHTYAQREKIDSILRVVPTLQDTGKKDAYFLLGKYYINISHDSAVMYLDKALILAKKYNDRNIEANTCSLLGVSEKNKGDFDKAITYHLQSLKINEELNNERSMAIAYNDLGVLYKTIGRLDEALIYYRKSNTLCRKINLSKGISMTYNNIGTILKTRNQHDSALFYYQLALRTAEETGDTYSISTCLANIGEMYMISGEYNKALDIFKRCLRYDRQNEDKVNMASSYLEIAQSLLQLRSYPAAVKFIDSAYTLCREEELTTMMLDVFRIQAEIYKAMGDNKTALAVMERYVATKDTLLDRETSKHIAEYQTRYETEKKEKEITTLKQQREIAELTVQKTRYQMLAILGIVLVLSIGTYLLYNRQQVKQKLAREKAVMAAEYNERLRIARDVHDDLGSGLSKISLMADIAQKKSANNQKLSNDIKNISTVSKELSDMLSATEPAAALDGHAHTHLNELGQGLSKISLTAQMAHKEILMGANTGNDIRQIAAVSKELVDNMRDLIWVLNPENTTLDNLVARLREYCADYLDGMGISFALHFPDHIPPTRISRESQRNIFSTVKEAINNCVKHSCATEINITLSLTHSFTVTVQDNGKGFDMAHLRGSGNGLRNMRQRIEAIGGAFTIRSAAATGTLISISVPLASLDLLKNTTIV